MKIVTHNVTTTNVKVWVGQLLVATFDCYIDAWKYAEEVFNNTGRVAHIEVY